MPCNIEAEQAILGTLLVNNEVFDGISNILFSDHFFDPLHARIFEIIAQKIQKNSLASPITIKPYFLDDTGLDELGGVSYLAKLAGFAISTFASSCVFSPALIAACAAASACFCFSFAL